MSNNIYHAVVRSSGKDILIDGNTGTGARNKAEQVWGKGNVSVIGIGSLKRLQEAQDFQRKYLEQYRGVTEEELCDKIKGYADPVERLVAIEVLRQVTIGRIALAEDREPEDLLKRTGPELFAAAMRVLEGRGRDEF